MIPRNCDSKLDTCPLYPGSSLLINKYRLDLAKERHSTSYTAFVLQIFTAVASVKDCYRRNLRGRASTIGHRVLTKGPFSTIILNEIYAAVDHYYGESIKLTKSFQIQNGIKLTKPTSSINKAITDKLLQINKHFNDLIAGVKDKSFNEEDAIGFDSYNLYLANPALFKDLDKTIDEEIKLSEQKKNDLNTSAKSDTSSKSDISAKSGKIRLKIFKMNQLN